MSGSIPLTIPRTRDAFFAPVTPAAGLASCRRLALGTAGLGGAWGDVKDDESVRTLHHAWDAGFLLTDTAPVYANAERVVGRALREWRGGASSPILCTKIGGWFADGTNHHTGASLAAQLDASQRLFGRAPDAVAIHDAEDWPRPLAHEAMEILVAQKCRGQIRAIGVGGGLPDLQRELLATGQVNYLITFKRLAAVTLQGARDIVPAAFEHRAAIFAASPLFMGLLTSRLPEFVSNRPEYIDPIFVRRALAVNELARQADISLAHLATRFVLSLPYVTLVLAGASTPAEWDDCVRAYEAGPLPVDLFDAICRIAHDSDEPQTGG